MKRSPLIRKTSLRRTAMKRTRKAKPLRKVYPDGRIVLSGVEWDRRKLEVWNLDRRNCEKCGCYVTDPIESRLGMAEIHHVFGRGMAGSKRDDRIWIEVNGNRVRNLVTRCQDCHAKETMQSQRPSKNAEL